MQLIPLIFSQLFLPSAAENPSLTLRIIPIPYLPWLSWKLWGNVTFSQFLQLHPWLLIGAFLRPFCPESSSWTWSFLRCLQTRHTQDHWHSRWINSWGALLVQTKFGGSSPQLQKVSRKPEGITVLLFVCLFFPETWRFCQTLPEVTKIYGRFLQCLSC